MKINEVKARSVNPIAVSVFFLIAGTGVALFALKILPITADVLIVLIALPIAGSIRIADQWEKAVVLRMGKYIGMRGPGPFLVIPVIDRVSSYIDQRIRVTDINAEQTLTKDTVPVNVDAILYWLVWDAEKSALEVQDYESAVEFMALTALRDIIGKHDLADLLQNREAIAGAMQTVLDEHTNPWGITCQNVGVKDILIPPGLSDAMSKQAQAERERQARIILGTAETEISEKFAQASKNYENNPVALQLRGMNMLFEGLKDKGSLMIVPSSALESMNIGALGGLSALAELHKTGKKQAAVPIEKIEG